MQKKRNVETQLTPFSNHSYPFGPFPCFYPEKVSFPSLRIGIAHAFFERSDIIALLDIRAPSEYSRNASSSSVLSHSLVALFILFSDPFTSYSSIPFFLLSANARRRNDFSGLCVSMTMVQNSARD